MSLNSLPRLAGCVFALTLALPASGESPVNSPAKPTAASARLAEGDYAAEIARLNRQLDVLRKEEVALRQQRRAQQAEEVRLVGAGATTTQVHAEIQSLRGQIDALDNQMGLLVYQINTLEARSGIPPQTPLAPAKATQVPPAPAKKAILRSKPVIAPDKIKAAATRFSGNAAPTVADARQAARELLTSQPVAFSDLDIEQLALLVMLQAQQDNIADIRTQLAAMKDKNDQLAALRAARPSPANTPDNPIELSPEDRRQLLEISERQTKLEHVILELTQKISDSQAKSAPGSK